MPSEHPQLLQASCLYAVKAGQPPDIETLNTLGVVRSLSLDVVTITRQPC